MDLPQVLVSTGVFIGRPNGRNHRLLWDVASRVEADGFELMLYDDWYPFLDRVVSDLLPLGLCVPVLHVEKGIGHLIGLGGEENRQKALEQYRANLWTANQFGAKKLVLHLWNGPSLDTAIERNLEIEAELRRMATAEGLLLTVENVVTYGETADHPLDYMKRLLELDPDVCFTYDLKMAAFHLQNSRVWEPSWSFLWEKGRVAHLHVSDYAGGFMDWKNLRTRHLGEGHIDFEDFFRRYNQTERCDTVTLECLSFREDGSLDVDGINEDVRKLRNLLK
jgi:sugar phosphate isomerase/epimerase